MFAKITLKRTECNGVCPVYKLTIYENGMVKYNGEKFVSFIGEHQWEISKNQIFKINTAIKQYKYFDLKKDESCVLSTCMPSCITSVKMKVGRFREIENYYRGYEWPKWLKAFETRIENIVGAKELINEI